MEEKRQEEELKKEEEKKKAQIEEEEQKKEEESEEESSELDIDMLQADAYIRHLQKETYSENIQKALERNQYDWDISEFTYSEKHVEGSYSYLDKFYDDDFEHLAQYYESCLLFMKQGHLPKEIQSKTLKYLWAFGESQFFEEDVMKLNAWATSI